MLFKLKDKEDAFQAGYYQSKHKAFADSEFFVSTSKFKPGLLGVEDSKSKSLRKFEVEIFKKKGDNEWMGTQMDNALYNFYDHGGSSPMSAQITMEKSVSKVGNEYQSGKIDPQKKVNIKEFLNSSIKVEKEPNASIRSNSS